MAKTSRDTYKMHFHWTNKVGTEDDDDVEHGSTLKHPSSNPNDQQADKQAEYLQPKPHVGVPTPRRKKLQAVAIARIRALLTAFGKNRSNPPFGGGLGPRVVGTLFGSRRGHVHFAFQKQPNSLPAFLVELATPISGLVREMASGLVRIALECDKKERKEDEGEKKDLRLLQEPVWRTYCNGKKCGFATRRDCGAKEWNVLKAVEPISMGAGVLPVTEPEAGSGDGELMYMRAKFERIIGSRDSEAFYMMNPDSNGAPELSIYLLRV
ncbi:Protein MIZU-KUSSEI 1 [Hibiscus syriacus]|uniref:Protein MIZU-KUSSEI 1 n=1 Tax=Hibiscus syriacus TaxID=106335 RepID=A0A6A2WF23_HIBSY|nr:protein MIZU-KUSSEI 1-like [Hibiscus syriacus]KAE8657123.1 Protein MIZU-KUSSEI 1 [Hibiscus syriacus]